MTERGGSIGASIDVEACAEEPIRVPGAIQPFGVLLLVNSSDYVVRQASANAGDLFNRPLDDVLGRSLSDLFSNGSYGRLMRWLSKVRERPATLADFHVDPSGDGSRYRPVAHRVETGYVLELERESADLRGEHSNGNARDAEEHRASLSGRSTCRPSPRPASRQRRCSLTLRTARNNSGRARPSRRGRRKGEDIRVRGQRGNRLRQIVCAER